MSDRNQQVAKRISGDTAHRTMWERDLPSVGTLRMLEVRDQDDTPEYRLLHLYANGGGCEIYRPAPGNSIANASAWFAGGPPPVVFTPGPPPESCEAGTWFVLDLGGNGYALAVRDAGRDYGDDGRSETTVEWRIILDNGTVLFRGGPSDGHVMDVDGFPEDVECHGHAKVGGRTKSW